MTQENNCATPCTNKQISNESIDKPIVSTSLSSNRKGVVDETKLSADEAKILEERRAYNRECATRARKRVKQTISHLESQVKELQDDKTELRRCLAAMENRLISLTNENRAFVAKIQIATDHSASNVIYNSRIDGLANLSLPSPQLLQLKQQQRQLNSFHGRGFY